MTVTAKVRRTVIARDEERCQRCGRDLSALIPRGDYSLQHRRARGMGGTSRSDADQPPNLVLLCGSGTTGCHGWVESNRAAARLNGWTIYQQDAPQLVAVAGPDSSWWFLNADGTRVEWHEDEGEMIDGNGRNGRDEVRREHRGAPRPNPR